MKKDSPQSNRIIKYYRPYHDSSGEQFYLPKEWKKSTMIGRGRKKEKRDHHWQESKINYEFDNEMNGTQLIRNLNWLGRTNDLIEKMETEENNSSSVDEINEDEDEERKKSKLLGHGSSSLRRKSRDNNGTVDERDLKCALPEMNNTLSNWTLHGQNLGSMLANSRAQCRNMKKK